ncbi:helix-turn-helix domain-containing protein [Glycocaulis abyssi]|uniref:Helix-turn-helix domain-containing protein n=1 Tax=Glycocaulis abyssi TaxID=1433403 RepID=A0ABV9NFV5_9PROT
MRKQIKMSYLLEKIAGRLKQAREDKGLSQRALAQLTGVPQSHISKIESGAVDIRLSSLVAISRTLELELELVPKQALPAVQALIRSVEKPAKNGDQPRNVMWSAKSAYQLEGDDDD